MRLGNLVRHLPGFGWEVDVIAGPIGSHSDETLAVGVDPERVSRVEPVAFGPHRQRADWAVGALRQARRMARLADVVFVSGGPFAPFAIAPLLSRPFVLDFRDPWSWEPRFGRFDDRLHLKLGRMVERQAEGWSLGRAARIVTVAPEISAGYERLYPQLVGRFETLRHGWEPSEFQEPVVVRNEEPELVYAGTFLAEERTPELLLETARLVRARGTPLGVRLLGALPAHLRGFTRVAESEGWLRVDGLRTHLEAVSALRRAAVLWAQPGELTFLITGKIYEYLASGPPIVAVAPRNGALAALLQQSGGAVMSDPTPNACADAVLAALAGRVPPRRDEVLAEFAAPQLGRRLAALLERARA
jgi:glycosyltransferase involved in cell wall biosynthesis